jgi:DNA-binding NarL/FixJ family response regulator
VGVTAQRAGSYTSEFAAFVQANLAAARSRVAEAVALREWTEEQRRRLDRQTAAKIAESARRALATTEARRPARAAARQRMATTVPLPGDDQVRQSRWEEGRRFAYAHSCGATYKAIGEAVGLSPETVRVKIVRHLRRRSQGKRSPAERYLADLADLHRLATFCTGGKPP